MIYEVRLRDLSKIKNFVTYVIAEDDHVALRLAIELAGELQADEVRSVVAKPKMSLIVLYEALKLASPRMGPNAIKNILKLSKQAFKGFKGYK